MDNDLRTLTWKVTAADDTLSNILRTGDRLMFYGDGDTCRILCVDKRFKRRPVWDNAYVCEAAKPIVDKTGAVVKVLGISGAMLSREHGPYVLDATLIETRDMQRLYCEVRAVHKAHEQPLANRLANAIGGDGDALSKLSLNGDDPFGHASGQWHADPD